MKFCPQCNAKMRPKKIIDESSSKTRPKSIIICSSCGYKEKSRRVTVKEKKIEDTKNIKVVDSKAQKLQSMPTTKANCHKCGHDSAYFWEKQTSSLEEASTQFFRCAKCEHTWRAS